MGKLGEAKVVELELPEDHYRLVSFYWIDCGGHPLPDTCFWDVCGPTIMSVNVPKGAVAVHINYILQIGDRCTVVTNYKDV